MSLPDLKYMNHVRDALWSPAGRASVMIGSGFSKNAHPTRPGVGELPLWHELAAEMFNEVHPSSLGGNPQDALNSASDHIAPLGLAQEYKDAFGPSGLHLFLQQQVRDGDFNPGEFHSRLLKLPWRDVFTTNWDTLLERTRLAVPERPYSVVHNKDEIPLSAQPRIFKLHGSLDGHYPLIAAEEDYRTYPQVHAPFVNTVQQAMMETAFCLIGFSGSDPNFLSWSSWVHKNLGEAAPRIYLAGWLDLSADERDCLQARNVVAIDLARHPKASQWPKHLRHKYATDWILCSLEGGRPYDVSNWPAPYAQGTTETHDHLQPFEVVTSDNPIEEPWSPPRAEDSQSFEDSTRETLTIWANNRRVYPGWLMAPLEVRSSLISVTHEWESTILESLSGLTPIERLNAIRELIWRHEIALEPISSELESTALDSLAHIDCESQTTGGRVEPQAAWPEVREAWREIALTLVTVARYRLDKGLFFQRIEALAQFLTDDPNVRHRIHHERCLWALWSLDFGSLDSLLTNWTTENCDPMWMLRKAALLGEAGRGEDAGALTEHAIADIRRFPVDNRSVTGPSREAWALWSTISPANHQEVFKRWKELAPRRCDAYAEKAHVANALSSKSGSSDPPNFDLASADVLSFHFGATSSSAPAYRATRLSEVAGLPAATPDMFPSRAAAADILQLAADYIVKFDPELAVRLVLRACVYDKDKTLLRVLSRTRLALVQGDVVRRLADDCKGVIDYGLPRGWVERIRVAIEVLSRLVLRLGPEAALESFDYALEFYRNKQHKVASDAWISSPLRNLLNRTWEALPHDQQTSRALNLLGTPIVGLDGFTSQIEEHYPDPGELVSGDPKLRLPDRSDDKEAQWQDVVSLLIRALRAGEEPRRRAATRLVPIADRGLLTDAETSEVANALWAAELAATGSLPDNTSLSDWMFLILPEPKPRLAAERFSREWLSGQDVKSRLDVTGSGGTVSVSVGAPPNDPTKLEDTLWNIGAAIAGMRTHGRQFELTAAERKKVVGLVSQWANSSFTWPPHDPIDFEIRRYTLWALRGLAPILSEVEIPAPTGEILFEKLKGLTESGTPAYGPISGLVRILPHRATELATWLRTGLASGNRSIAAGALSGLASWLQISTPPVSSMQSPPEDMLREVGLIIAARRKESLSEALQVAKWVFDKGSDHLRTIILSSALEGLDYLAEELRYEREHDNGIPNLRWRCAQLASSMSKAGLECRPEVIRWLELASNDPFPEVRYAMSDNLIGMLVGDEPEHRQANQGEGFNIQPSTRNS